MTSSAPLPLAGVLRGICADPGRPRLTWYGPSGERIELSGHVLDNWVTKTTNLLVEEFTAGPGTRVLLDLPPHWRTVVWAFAVWRAGACVVLPGGGLTAEDCDVVVTDRPDRVSATGPEIVAVALPALARRFDGALPPGAMDAAGAVMTYGDVLTWLPEPDTSREALLVGTHEVSHQELLGWASGTATASAPPTVPVAGPGPAGRVLLEPGADDVPAVLAGALAAYAGLGSLVLCAPEVGAELATDPARRQRLVETERITG